jgi:hypothetical protein
VDTEVIDAEFELSDGAIEQVSHFFFRKLKAKMIETINDSVRRF